MASGWALAAMMLMLMPAAVAIASPICRPYGGHELCIHQIKRSAKYFWEYRAIIAIDGQKRPLEIYDCRHRQRVNAQGERVPFQDSGPGPLICRLVQR